MRVFSLVSPIRRIRCWLFLSCRSLFKALNKEIGGETDVSIQVLDPPQNFPEGVEEEKNEKTCAPGAKHLELEHRPHIHNKALELRAMWRNLQMLQTGLSWSPVATLQDHRPRAPPPPTHTPSTPTRQFSTCSRLSFNPPQHGSH